jgi:hypothetical protein
MERGGGAVTKLHELPPDHPLRNTAIKDIDGIQMVCRHTKSRRDPRTWKIKVDTFNRLNDSWQNNFDWVINK